MFFTQSQFFLHFEAQLRTFLRSNRAKSEFLQLFEWSLNFDKKGNYKTITKILLSNRPKMYRQNLCSEGQPWQYKLQ